MTDALLDLAPQNYLEEMLLAGQRGEITNQDFLNRLLTSTLILLVDQPADGPAADGETLRTFCVTDGRNASQRMLATFTDSQRAEPFRHTNSEFTYIVQVPAPLLLQDLEDGLGIIVNPNSQLNFRIDPVVAARLRAHYREQA